MGLPFVDLPNLFIDDPYFFYLPDEKIAPAVLCRGFFFFIQFSIKNSQFS